MPIPARSAATHLHANTGRATRQRRHPRARTHNMASDAWTLEALLLRGALLFLWGRGVSGGRGRPRGAAPTSAGGGPSRPASPPARARGRRAPGAWLAEAAARAEADAAGSCSSHRTGRLRDPSQTARPPDSKARPEALASSARARTQERGAFREAPVPCPEPTPGPGADDPVGRIPESGRKKRRVRAEGQGRAGAQRPGRPHTVTGQTGAAALPHGSWTSERWDHALRRCARVLRVSAGYLYRLMLGCLWQPAGR